MPRAKLRLATGSLESATSSDEAMTGVSFGICSAGTISFAVVGSTARITLSAGSFVPRSSAVRSGRATAVSVSFDVSTSSPPSSMPLTASLTMSTPTTRELVTKVTPAATAELCSASTIFCHPSST